MARIARSLKGTLDKAKERKAVAKPSKAMPAPVFEEPESRTAKPEDISFQQVTANHDIIKIDGEEVGSVRKGDGGWQVGFLWTYKLKGANKKEAKALALEVACALPLRLIKKH